MPLRRPLLATCSCVAFSSLTLSAVVHADETPAPEPVWELAPLEVTAQHRSEKAQDVPISLKVFEQADVEEQGLKTLSDALNRTANVWLRSDTGSIGFANITIRGLGNQGGAMAGGDQAIGVYVDDVFMGAQTAMNPLLGDVARVEVLRGPQGTLYGRNTLGGAINLHTNTPEPETEAKVEGSIGSHALYDLKAMANGALFKGRDATVSARINAVQGGQGTTVKNSLDDDVGDTDQTGARAQTRLTTETLDAVISADYLDQDGHPWALAPFADAPKRKVAYVNPFEYEVQNFGVSANARLRLGSLTLQSITAWRGSDSRLDGGDWSASDALQQGYDRRQRQLSQELRLMSPDDARWRWVSGLFFFHNKEDETNYYGHRRGGSALWGMFRNGEREVSNSTVTTNSQAAFGDVTYGLTPWLDITAGARLTHDHKSTDYTHVSQIGMAPSQTLDDEIDAFDASPKVSLILKPDQDLRFYATVSRGYKSGGFNRQFVPTTKLDFKPEHAWNYELGSKGRLFDGRLDVAGTLFYTDWKNQQVTSWHGTYNDIANVPHSRSYGAELEVEAHLTRALTLGGQFGWTEATFVDFPSPSASLSSGDGLRQPNAPRFTWGVNAQVRQPVAEGLEVTARADYTHRSTYYYDITNTLKEPGYGLLDLRAGLGGDRWTLSAFVRNATDERYRVQAISYMNEAMAIAGEGRVIGLEGSLAF
ncbi:TonB-dependent receptor [Pararhodospirillum photometricum]|uniref:TonB-dependent receptor n=1 Tax=Pararhodospirillum photometricum DSM 122 TaxID=1150469 RepID=H6SPT2_PARPM|nr:TonB-dependent receptor [Pararhodospirillum photometricum]CCG07202.1 TonB-dependent receptor [Pararhodospirillum photometricum DSM 122]